MLQYLTNEQWSPQQISGYLLRTEGLRISHETIYKMIRADKAAGYDYIEGGVANDRVINTIGMYMQGYYSEEYALRLLALHRPNNQICIRNQGLIDTYLHYERT